MHDKERKLTTLELRDRWLTEEGHLFRDEIIRQLQSEENENAVDWENLQIIINGKEVNWVDFPGVKEIECIYLDKPNYCTFAYNMLIEFYKNERLGDLRGIYFDRENLENANLSFTQLENASFWETNLKRANLTGANLKEADLYESNLMGTNLTKTNLEGVILEGAKFSLKSFFYRIGIIKFKFWIYKKCNLKIIMVLTTNLYGAEIKNCLMSGSPVTYRTLLDEQYLDDFAVRHKYLYSFWLVTSNCGRSFLLVFLWSLLIALSFGLVYATFQAPYWLPSCLQAALAFIDPQFEGLIGTSPWWKSFYMSFVTMTTLGWSSVEPANTAGFWWHTAQNLFGYIWLGYLIAVLGDKLTRRSV